MFEDHVSVNCYAPVLLAEDEAADVLFLRRALKKASIPNPLVHVADGREAIRYLSGEGEFADRDKHPLPALILLDLHMPHCDGFGLLAWLRAQAGLSEIPAVVISSSQADEDRARCAQLGVRDYFQKPLVTDQLVPIVSQLQEKWLAPSQSRPGAAAPALAPQAPILAPAPATPQVPVAGAKRNPPLSTPASSHISFREAASASLACRPEDVERVIFRRCLYLRARLASLFLPKSAFAADWKLIRAVASAASIREVIAIVNAHRSVHPDEKNTMHVLKLRLSGRKVIRLAEKVFAQNQPP